MIASHNTIFRLGDIKRLVHEAFDSIYPDICKKCVEKAIEIEEEYKAAEQIMNNIPPVIIDFATDEEDEIYSDSGQ